MIPGITTLDATIGGFKVKTNSGKLHTVEFGKQSTQPSCSCRDWMMRHHIPCRRFYDIALQKSESTCLINKDIVALDAMEGTDSYAPPSGEPVDIQPVACTGLSTGGC